MTKGSLRDLAERPAVCPVILSIPFLVVIVLSHGLTQPVSTFHGADELCYHYPVIQKFAVEFPRLDLSDYQSATTPLFHILFALAGKAVGFELYKLRFLNVLVSYLAVWVLFRLLHRDLRVGRGQALTFALLFALSPYFFGASFILLTDNLALLFCFLTLRAAMKFRQTNRLRDFAVTSGLMAACLLTRQIHFWLTLIAGYYLATSPLRIQAKAGGLTVMAACLLPLGLLMITWRGLVPPSFSGYEGTPFNIRPVNYFLALVGLYAFLCAPQMITQQFAPRWQLGVLVVAGVVLLVLRPMSWVFGDDGYLWRVSAHVPAVYSSSVVFWLLVPMGLIAIYDYAVGPDRESLPLVYLAAFALVSLSNRVVYQKYYDPFALLLVFLLTGRRSSTRFGNAGRLLMGLGFIAYALLHALQVTT